MENINNPFAEIDKRFNRLENLIKSIKEDRKPSNRIVNLEQFAKYSGMAKATVYVKLHKGEHIPGAFKPGKKLWFFDLNQYDKFIAEKAEQMA